MYMTRQLSFAGVTFDIKELPLSKDFTDMYDASVQLVSDILLFPVILLSAAWRYFSSDLKILCLVNWDIWTYMLVNTSQLVKVQNCW